MKASTLKPNKKLHAWSDLFEGRGIVLLVLPLSRKHVLVSGRSTEHLWNCGLAKAKRDERGSTRDQATS